MTRQLGFTLMEAIITMLLVGLLAAFSVPKLLGLPERDFKARVKSMYMDMGEMYMMRRQNTAAPYGLEDVGGNEHVNFHQYMTDHLNYLRATAPVAAGNCYNSTDDANPLFQLDNGMQVRSICDVDAAVDYLKITVRVPKKPAVVLDYDIVIPEGLDRYTTLYGYTATSCTEADEILQIVGTCP